MREPGRPLSHPGGRPFLRAAFCALAVLAATACTPASAGASDAPLTRAPDGRPLTLVFSDDFDSLRVPEPGKPMASAIWRTTFGASASPTLDNRTIRTNKELQLYVDGTMTDGRGRALGLSPFKVHDGVLDIVADRAPAELRPVLGGYAYTSGLITSLPSFSQTYGYFEARVKLPRGKGLWPALWLLPVDQSWPPEIDIMESVGDPSKAVMTVHTSTMQTQGVAAHPAAGAFHVFAVAWDARQIVFYMDGVETARSPTPADMHKPMYILANMALGGDWAGAPDDSTPFPARFTIDYIRAYRFAR